MSRWGGRDSCFAQGTNLVLLDPDVAEAFPDSESVNHALRSLIQLARRVPAKSP